MLKPLLPDPHRHQNLAIAQEAMRLAYFSLQSFMKAAIFRSASIA
jgi:hypothetical protein